MPGNKESFPAEFQAATRLYYYSSLFNSVEINSSFYKTPLPKTFAKWAQEVGENFRFTVKMSSAITHSKQLDFNADDLCKFMHAANHLEGKNAALLLQFPASIKAHYFLHVEKIIQQVQALQPSNHPWDVVIELRDRSWYNTDVYNMLTSNGASLVFHDMPASKTPLEQTATHCVYFRFHGYEGDYKGSYSEQDIKQFAEQIRIAHSNGKHVFAYFNNTIGDAYQNALSLQYQLEDLLPGHKIN